MVEVCSACADRAGRSSGRGRGRRGRRDRCRRGRRGDGRRRVDGRIIRGLTLTLKLAAAGESGGFVAQGGVTRQPGQLIPLFYSPFFIFLII